MSESRELLDEGISVLMGELGATFTVEGDPTPRTGGYDAFIYGNVITDNGIIQKRGAILTFPRATWTPEIGRRVTVEGLTFVVDAIQPSFSHFSVTLVESHVP